MPELSLKYPVMPKTQSAIVPSIASMTTYLFRNLGAVLMCSVEFMFPSLLLRLFGVFGLLRCAADFLERIDVQPIAQQG